MSARNTRRGAKLLSIPIHITIFQQYFLVSDCRLQNNLPDYNIRIDNLACFRARLNEIALVDVVW